MVRAFMSRDSLSLRRAVATVLAIASVSFLSYSFVNAAEETAASEEKEKKKSDDVTELSDMEVSDDPTRMLPNEISGSSFGFAKPLVETPRSVAFVSQEQIALYDLSSVADLSRVVAGAYTPARYGIEGSIDVRGVPADTYIRGMKRVVLQGNARSVLAAMDSIEVVKGPPSPIYGLGKIGGYTNFVPKSGRAAVGGYLPSPQGFLQATEGTYDRRDLSAGVGGPVDLAGKHGGYYAYGMLSDSNAYYVATPTNAKILQLASSFDNVIGPFRLETGSIYQDATTAGALSGRASQALVENETYIKGTPLVNLDLNGNGRVGWLELNRASPVLGTLNANNQPMAQNWAWPKDAAGNYLPIDQFPKIAGIPQTMLTYLNAHPEADPTGLIRAAGALGTGPKPISGQVPVGFVLDPRTVGYTKLTDYQRRRASAHERELNAKFLTVFADMVYDTNPDFTVKNQVFFDSIDQYKISNQPLFLRQNVWVAEDKVTVTKRLNNLPSWLKLNNLASLNVRRTMSHTSSGLGGDWSSTRVDITKDDTWIDQLEGKIPTTTFATYADNPDINNDGAPETAEGQTDYWEYGLGLLWDVNLFEKTNLVLGGRYDYIDVKNRENALTFNTNGGTSLSNPGSFRPVGSHSSNSDHGLSYSVSLTHKLPFGIVPYVTFAHSSVGLEGSNNRISDNIVNGGALGAAELQEAGIKASMLNNKLFMSVAGFKQERIEVSASDDPNLLTTEASSTSSKGIEAEIKWVIARGLNVGLFGIKETTEYLFDNGGTNLIDARTLGFQDVLNPDGSVLYPAEAFLYGGRPSIVIPAGLPQYKMRPSNPEYQVGMNASWELESKWGFNVSANYNSHVCAARLCLTDIPSVTVVNAGVHKAIGNWDLKLDVTNLTNEYFYRPRQLNGSAELLVTAMPLRRTNLTAKYSFK